jgi:hypothetical protein
MVCDDYGDVIFAGIGESGRRDGGREYVDVHHVWLPGGCNAIDARFAPGGDMAATVWCVCLGLLAVNYYIALCLLKRGVLIAPGPEPYVVVLRSQALGEVF